MFWLKRKRVSFFIAICIMYQSYYVKAESDLIISRLDSASSIILEQHDSFLKHLDGLDVIDTKIKSDLITSCLVQNKSTELSRNFVLRK
ncbi:hypothetical protein BK708_00270 [Bacillus thuringiensis serovar yunnanensis]|nr:hypothetical protein BK708_00270 [Bacillus thuringiensis serovar yunnanensis]